MIIFIKKLTFIKMKKKLLSIFGALTLSFVIAQTPSPSWTISQNAAFSNTSAGIKFMDALNSNIMWVIGYDGTGPRRNYNWFSKTLNGGTTFTSGNVYADTNSFVIANMEGIDATTAWVSSYLKPSQDKGAIHRTTNGGLTWINMTGPGMFTGNGAFTDFVSFLTPSIGIALGDPVNGEFEIWKTINGGTSWSLIPGGSIPNPFSASEYGIVNLYAKEGTTNYWFGTNLGRIYYSTDAGSTWNVSQVSANSTTITEIAFSTALNGLAYGFGSGNELYSTTNGGVSWTQITNLSPNIGWNDVVGIPGTNFFASVGAGAGNNIISYSTNNGVTWTDWGSTNIQYLTADFINSSTAWAGGFSDNMNASLGGVWKYNGSTFNSVFTIPLNICKVLSTVTMSPINNSTGTGTLSYNWTASPAGVVFSSPTASVPVVTFSNTGTYTLVLTVISAVGTSTSSQVINVLNCALPVPSFSTPVNVCNNVAMTLTNSSSGSPNPNISVSVLPAAGVTVSPIIGTQTVGIKIASPGIYSITLIASSITGSAAITQTLLVKNCSPTISFTVPIRVCSPTETIQTVNTTTAIGAFTYTWSIIPQSGISMFSNVGNNKKIVFDITNFPAPPAPPTTTNYTLTLTGANASGTNTSSQIITVGPCDPPPPNFIGEKSTLENSLIIYPNPAKDQISLILPNNLDGYKIKIINLLGSMVYEDYLNKNYKDTYTINLANKAKGVYFLTVESKFEKVTKKIIIE